MASHIIQGHKEWRQQEMESVRKSGNKMAHLEVAGKAIGDGWRVVVVCGGVASGWER